MFKGGLGEREWEGAKLRFELERGGVRLSKGFHAKDDEEPIRDKVFGLIAQHDPRFDVTLLHKKKQQAATAAIQDVIGKFKSLDIKLCVWDSSTSWGLQVADYGLWAVQRELAKRDCIHFIKISPLVETVTFRLNWVERGEDIDLLASVANVAGGCLL